MGSQQQELMRMACSVSVQLYNVFIFGAFDGRTELYEDINTDRLMELILLERNGMSEDASRLRDAIQESIKQGIQRALDHMLARQPIGVKQDQLLDLKLQTVQASSSTALLEVIRDGIFLIKEEIPALTNKAAE